MNNFPFIDIFILAMIAVFIINRLRNSLGKKTGNETDIAQKFSQKPSKFTESNPDKEIRKSKNQVKEAKNIILHKNSSINEKLNNIVKVDPSFTVENFIDGAKKAFEYILVKYSENDLKSLKSLLAPQILTNFTDQIKLRQKQKQILGITILKIDDPEIIDVSIVKNKLCFIKLEFKSQQVQTTKDSDNKIIDGNDNLILNISELWTFSKEIKNKNPNWILEKIEENN
jgi:predicted lipid-binding transport protein (Tim44 family)